MHQAQESPTIYRGVVLCLTDLPVLADAAGSNGRAETSLHLLGLEQTRFEDNASPETVSLRQRGQPRHAGHEEGLVPRNLIEEFDPGSA